MGNWLMIKALRIYKWKTMVKWYSRYENTFPLILISAGGISYSQTLCKPGQQQLLGGWWSVAEKTWTNHLHIGEALSSRGAVLDCDQMGQTGRGRPVHLGQSVAKRAFIRHRVEDGGSGRDERKKRKSGGDGRWRRGRSPEAAAAWTGRSSALCLSSTPQRTERQARAQLVT